jgi:hypothetical protein
VLPHAAVSFWRFRCLDSRHGSVESNIMTLTTCNHGKGRRALLPPYMSVTKGRLEVWSVASPAQVCTGFHTDYRGPADSSLKLTPVVFSRVLDFTLTNSCFPLRAMMFLSHGHNNNNNNNTCTGCTFGTCRSRSTTITTS